MRLQPRKNADRSSAEGSTRSPSPGRHHCAFGRTCRGPFRRVEVPGSFRRDPCGIARGAIRIGDDPERHQTLTVGSSSQAFAHATGRRNCVPWASQTRPDLMRTPYPPSTGKPPFAEDGEGANGLRSGENPKSAVWFPLWKHFAESIRHGNIRHFSRYLALLRKCNYMKALTH